MLRKLDENSNAVVFRNTDQQAADGRGLNIDKTAQYGGAERLYGRHTRPLKPIVSRNTAHTA